jgi:phenylacetate-CoA ligase
MDKLKRILKYAYENVAFYHYSFNEARIKPENINSLEDLTKIPVLTKSEVQRNFTALISKQIDLDRCKRQQTSGTTGTPLTLVAEKRVNYLTTANKFRHQVENGSNLFRDKCVLLLPVKGYSKRGISLETILEAFGLFRRTTMDIQCPIEEVIENLVDFKPDLIDALPSFLLLLAKEMRKRGDCIHPRLIFTSGELLDAESRKLITSALKAEIFDVYGCTEIGNIAWECSEHVGYHINTDMAVTEFTRDGEHVSEGENGEILLTSLWNFAMPLIRYKIGDVGTPSNESCPCGRGLPLMRVIEGRFDDFIVLPSGRVISPYVTSRCFANIQGITEYRIVQEADKSLIIQLVLAEGHKGDVFSQLRASFTRELGEEMVIDIEVVNAFPGKGKLRRVVSKCLSREQFLSADCMSPS